MVLLTQKIWKETLKKRIRESRNVLCKKYLHKISQSLLRDLLITIKLITAKRNYVCLCTRNKYVTYECMLQRRFGCHRGISPGASQDHSASSIQEGTLLVHHEADNAHGRQFFRYAEDGGSRHRSSVHNVARWDVVQIIFSSAAN